MKGNLDGDVWSDKLWVTEVVGCRNLFQSDVNSLFSTYPALPFGQKGKKQNKNTETEQEMDGAREKWIKW